MTLTERLLPELSEWTPTGDGRHSLGVAIPAAGWNVQFSVDRADSLSCLVWNMTLTRIGTAPPGSTLRTWAEGIAKRATGLLEPLILLEVDDTRAEAILRSESPATRGQQLAYYEVQLFGLDRATVCRYTASRAASGREQVAFALTHEVLAKLAGDIAG